MGRPTRQPHLRAAGEGDALWFFGGLLTFVATTEQTGGAIVAAEMIFPQDMVTPLNVQPREATNFYVLEGSVVFFVGEEPPFTASAGAFIHVPIGVAHAFRIASEAARLLTLTTPEHEQFFRAAGVPARVRTCPPADHPIDMERVEAAAARFGVEIVGPPPAG